MTLANTLAFSPGSPCCPCTPANLVAYLPWHTVASHTIHVVRIRIDAFPAYTTGGCNLPQEWTDFADAINSGGSLRGIVLFADNANQLSRPAAADGFAVQMDLAAGFVGATGYRRINKLTIARGVESIVYEYDAASDRLKRNDDLTTLSLCMNLQFHTFLFPRLFTAAEYAGGAGVYTTTITLAGFGGHASCTNLNGANGVTKRTFLVILGGVVTDGYVFYTTFHDSVNFSYPTYKVVGGMELFPRSAAAVATPVGVPFPLFSTGPVSPASFGYVYMLAEGTAVPAAAHSAGFYVRSDHARYPTAPFAASDFIYSGIAPIGGVACPIVGPLDIVTEVIT